jgi:raffinose/stachyose/melibiose transport system permease protein
MVATTPPQALRLLHKPPRRPRRPRLSLGTPISYLAAVLVVGITLVPILYVVIGGFRTSAQINSSPAGLPHPWVLSNYTNVLTSSSFWHFVGNSVFIAVVSTGLAVVLGAMAAFALARYAFRGREFFFALFMIGLLFPAGVAVLPLYLLLRQIGLLENLLGVAIPEAAFALPITIFILRPFLRAVPGELEDAAVVDGASRLGFFRRILLPLSRPAITTVAILAFVTSWNSYLLPLVVFTNPQHYTLPLGVWSFQSTHSVNTAIVLAFAALSMVPALAFFMLAERRIVGGLTGALKG